MATIPRSLFELKQLVRALNRQRLQQRRLKNKTDARSWLQECGTPPAAWLSKAHERLLRAPVVPIHVIVDTDRATQEQLKATMESLAAAQQPGTHVWLVNASGTQLSSARVWADGLPVDQMTASAMDWEGAAEPDGWVLHVQAGTQLMPHALIMLHAHGAAHSETRLLYSDTLLRSGQREQLEFKPAFSYDYLLSYGYIEGFCAIRSRHWRGNFWDSVFEVIEASDDGGCRHVPWVLAEVMHDAARHAARLPAIMSHLARRHPGAQARLYPRQEGVAVTWAVPPGPPEVTVVIPTKDQPDLLRKCLHSLLKGTRYPNVRFLVIDNGTTDPLALGCLAEARQDPRVTVLEDRGPFNYSRLNNQAIAAHVKSEFICLMNNDVEAIDGDWLHTMVGLASRDDVGCVGAKLLYGNGTVQHGGVVLGIGSTSDGLGVAAHLHKALGRHDPGYAYRAVLDQNYSAVTAACLLIRRTVFEAIGGFNEEELAVAYNDIDLCLRLGEAGKRVVWSSQAVLYHHESVSRGKDTNRKNIGRFTREVAYMRQRWGHLLANDPFYSPNFSLRYANCAPRLPGERPIPPLD
ncbi:glycosyltransferase family 2 protein [Aquabacterium lacunae]|nr:glycosyltransferase family 2 protein [Aquabacterium lacunae]